MNCKIINNKLSIRYNPISKIFFKLNFRYIFIYILSIILCFNLNISYLRADNELKDNKKKSHNHPINSFSEIITPILPAIVNISTSKNFKNTISSIEDEMIKEFSKFLSDNNLFNLPLFNNNLDNLLNYSNNSKKQSAFSLGSGFIISDDGYIVTNYHVIADADRIIVSLHNKQKYNAKIIGIDAKTDLALLKINIDKKQKLKYLQFANSNNSKIGDWILAIGNPFGLGSSVSFGIVSAMGRDIDKSNNFIQTDAAINKGNSGGPLINMNGQVIGIATAIFSPSGGNIGIGFANPSNIAKDIIYQLKKNGKITRSWIGISIENVTSEIANSINMENQKGAIIIDVIPESPASKYGLKISDVIISFNNININNAKDLSELIEKSKSNTKYNIKIFRHGKIIEKKIITETIEDNIIFQEKLNNKIEQKFPNSKKIDGITVSELNNEIISKFAINSDKGILVIDVDDNSRYYGKLEIGDIIISINQNNINSSKKFANIVEYSKENQKNKYMTIIAKKNNTQKLVSIIIKLY